MFGVVKNKIVIECGNKTTSMKRREIYIGNDVQKKCVSAGWLVAGVENTNGAGQESERTNEQTNDPISDACKNKKHEKNAFQTFCGVIALAWLLVITV